MSSAANLISPPIAHADIRDFANARVNLPSETSKERRQKVNDLRERLDGWIAKHPENGLVKSYLSGSLAKGTALKTSSDIDVALYVKYDGAKVADHQFINWLADRLRQAYPQMSEDQIEPQEYSVKITYKEAGVDIDIVPVFYEGDVQNCGWLVSKKTGRLMLTSIPMHLAFTRKRKAESPVHFAQAVRLAKWWAAEQKATDAEFRFKSFMVELICAHLADNGQDFSDYRVGLEAFFNYIVKTGMKSRIVFTDYYPSTKVASRLTDPVQIFDPVNAENNVASQYTEKNRILMVNAAQDALDALNEAHMASSKSHAVEMWRIVLGQSFRG